MHEENLLQFSLLSAEAVDELWGILASIASGTNESGAADQLLPPLTGIIRRLEEAAASSGVRRVRLYSLLGVKVVSILSREAGFSFCPPSQGRGDSRGGHGHAYHPDLGPDGRADPPERGNENVRPASRGAH